MKLIKMLILSAFFALNLSALTEGVEYQTLAKPLNVPKNSVVKVFSYDCPHCYKFDRTITRKLMSKLEGVKFIPYHLSTKGKLGETTSKIFAALKQAKFAIYKARHDEKDDFNDGKDKQRFIDLALNAAHVSKDEYEKALSSDRAKELLNEWFASYDVASISGVPAFVVSGKYLINLSAASSIDEMAKTIKELLDK